MAADPPERSTIADSEAPTLVEDAGPAPAALLPRGTCLDRYLIVELVGRGGMGLVYRAYDPDLERQVALKLLKGAEGAAQRGRLLREAQALARLSHPHIVAVFDVGTYAGAVFLAMEFVEGPSLRSWLEAAPRSPDEILRAFLAAGEGLAAAHRAGLVHRDFKPDNVVVGEDQRVRVLDFGLVRAEGEAPPAREPSAGAAPAGGLHDSLTVAGAIMGTPRYMSPEQHLGGAVDARSDQFGFCVALHEALYGAPPFEGDTLEALKQNVIAGRFRPPPARRLPRRLRQVLLRGVAPSPAERFPSMEALLAALRQAARGRRRLALRVAAAALVPALAAAGWLALRQRQLQACGGAEQQLAGAWDPARRAQVERAFLATGLPIAPDALRGVTRALDAYAGSWVRQRREACEATRVRGEQSQELLELRAACLDDRLEVLRSLTGLYARADGRLVERATQAAQALPGLGACADAASLRAPAPPPGAPGARQRVEASRRQLASARALGLAGRREDGLAAARAVLDEAARLGYPRLEAEAQLQIGQLLDDAGDYPAAAGAQHRALLAAIGARDWEVGARAALGLVQVVGQRQGQHAEADRWVDLAEAYIGQLQRRDELLGLFHALRAELRVEEARYEEARADALRALELQQGVPGEDRLELARAHCMLARVEWYRAHYREALDGNQRCLALQRGALGQDHPALVETLVSVGDAYGDLGDHERALAEYRGALAMIRRVQPDHPLTARILNNMGKDLLALGRAREALGQFSAALEVNQRKAGSPVTSAFFLNNMGAAELELEDPRQALRYLRRALEAVRRERAPNDRAAGMTLTTMGAAYRKAGRPAQAADRFLAALTHLERAFGPAHPELIEPLEGLGAIAIDRQDGTRAVALLERARAISEADPGDGQQLADVRFALARALWSTGARPRALQLAEAAREAYRAAPGREKALAEVMRWQRGRSP